MNIDERIKQELESEAETIDEILNDKQGLFDLVADSFKAGLGPWVVIINIVILVVTGLMIWSGYEFFTAEQIQDQVFWGVCLVISAMAQIAMKQWVWLEMYRGSLLREIKRVEIAVARLSSKVNW